jgi:putative transferase (TIGR04331 family)
LVATLVTSPIESTWPKKGKIIFLGSWCCLFERKEKWSSYDYLIEDFHWDDRKKLLKNYHELEKIYENYLSEFSKYLNEFHHKEFSERFWRILIGPWLYSTINIVYDRWFMLFKVVSKQKYLKKFVLNDNSESLKVIDMHDFNKKIEEDEWNEALYSLLIEKFFSSNINIIHLDETHKKQIRIEEKNSIYLLKRIANFIAKFFSRNSDVFVISPYISHLNRFFLQINLKQFPVFWFQSNKKISFKKWLSFRNNSLPFSYKVLPEFEKVLNETLLNLIPQSYFESFEDLIKESQNQGWPNSTKCIFTSNAFISDEIFKCWAGIKTEEGAKLIIGQHGGNFGMTPMAIHESHQIKISDKWLSWGWDDPKNKKVLPIGNFKSSFKKIKHSQKGNALLVGMTLPRYSYYLYSVPIAGQVERYLNDQIKFTLSLSEKILASLKIRTYPSDRGWSQKRRWKEVFKNKISFDDNRIPLNKSLKKCRVFIGTYNATTYLETFSVNMPTIIFWDPKYWEINQNTKILFKKLEEEKIFHSCPTSAAKHLEEIWEDIDSWWFSSDVQKVVTEFNEVFSKKNPKFLKSIQNSLI